MSSSSGKTTVTKETRYALVQAENPAIGITLDEMARLVELARDAEVPGDTPVEGFGLFSFFGTSAPATRLQVKAVVTREVE